MLESILFIIAVSYSGALATFFIMVKWIEMCQKKDFLKQKEMIQNNNTEVPVQVQQAEENWVINE